MDATRFLAGYVAATLEFDLPETTGVRRNPSRMLRFLRAYAHAVSQPTSLKAIADLTGGGPDEAGPAALVRDTATAYRDALERMRVIADLPAWIPHTRSSKRFTVTPKRHLADPALAAHLLGVDSAGLRRDIGTAGLLFEALAVHDIRAYAEASGARALHYRSRDSREEIDCIVESTSGDWAAFEVTLGSADAIDDKVRKLAAIDAGMLHPAKALVVITASRFAEPRIANGRPMVQIVPLGALGA